MKEAWSLAKGKRLNEFKDKRVPRLDGRFVEPYSTAWGRVEACEHLWPELAGLRRLGGHGLLDDVCTPYTMWRKARDAAAEEFAHNLTKGA
jgi:hypothetical protein